MSTIIRKLLALDRFAELHQAWKVATSKALPERLPLSPVLFAIAIAMLPFLGGFVDDGGEVLTIAIGVATLFAIVYRVRHGIAFHPVGDWHDALRLTHTAFALGCVPAVLLILLEPGALTGVEKEAITSSAMRPNAAPETSTMLLWILQISTWAAVTEEFIFRGLLISVLRRWALWKTQSTADLVAVIVSGALFGLGHLPTWGPLMSLAVAGLGMGLGIAYIAVGERILPLIVYHLVFDVLSFSAALLMR